jgi:tetratricopeptide (TPR) repeat protein
MRIRPALLLSFVALSGLVSTPGAVLAQRPETLNVEEQRKRDAVEHYLRARLHAADSEFEEALKEFRKAVELQPNDGGLHREYADMLRELAVVSEAEKEARRAVELIPGDPGAHRVLGQVLLTSAKDKAGFEAAASELKRANDANPYDPVTAVSYAQALLKADKAQDAASALEKVLDRGRGSAIPLLYGEALEQSGQLEQAEELYRAVVQQDSDNRGALVSLLRVLERQHKFDDAVPIVEGFVKAQPGNLSLKSEYASLLMRARRFDDAGKVLQDVLKTEPGNREALRNYASLLSETRETDKADEILKRLQGLDPDDLEVPFRRALNFLDAHRIAEAEKILLELREKVVEKKKGEAELAQVDSQLGFAAYLRKDYKTAKARLEPHLFRGEEETINQQAFNLLTQIARDSEDWGEGRRLARQASQKSKSPNIRSTLGEFLWHSNDPAEKKEGEKVLADLAAENRAGALAAADAWQRLEQYGRAAATARTALETFKEDPDLLFRLAASLEREKKINESVAAFETLIKNRPDHAQGLNYLGYLWADRGENLQRALDLIRKAVALDPSNGAYLDSLGWVYFQLNDLPRAEENLKAAAALNPDDATVQEHLGDLFEKRGDIGRARQAWEKALTLKPDDGGKKIAEKLRRTARYAANNHPQ